MHCGKDRSSASSREQDDRALSHIFLSHRRLSLSEVGQHPNLARPVQRTFYLGPQLKYV